MWSKINIFAQKHAKTTINLLNFSHEIGLSFGFFGGENLDIKEPYMNNYCDKCKNHYLLDGDESRCRAISLGISSAMCVQVKECHKFNEKMEK